MSDCTFAVSSKIFDILSEKIKGKKISGEQLLTPKEENDPGVHVKWRYNLQITDIKIKLLPDSSIKFQDLKLQWNECALLFYEIDIPEICIGGGCLVRNPITGKCKYSAPEFCIFEGKEFPREHPLIVDLFPIKPFAQSEIFFICDLDTKYTIHEDRTPNMSDLEAEEKGFYNEWEIVGKRNTVDIDLIDFSGIFSQIIDEFEKFFKSMIDDVLAPFHHIIREGLKWLIGSVSDLIKKALNSIDDLDEWLTEKLRIPITFWIDDLLIDTILFIVLNYKIKNKGTTIIYEKIDLPIQSVKERLEIKKEEEITLNDSIGKVIKDENGNEVKQMLIPVRIKIKDFKIHTTEKELLLTWKVGI